MNVAALLAKKRDGKELTPEELGFFLTEFQEGRAADYQMAAFLMAVCIRGMTPVETAELTRHMVASGETLDFDHLPGVKADKHSTGGVGDWISLALTPLVTSLGIWVPMMAGRGLGHTGGTLDKLESIPGYRVDLRPREFVDIVGRVGGVIAGQTRDLAPLDKNMYALRDVTGTVESAPLIVSSILSKKKAEGIDVLVMDVKCGRGAFMKTHDQALELARELCRVGELLGLKVVAFITQMDRPLGRHLGNALEVRAAVECLQGRGPADSVEVLRTLATAMACLAGGGSWEEAWEATGEALTNGAAFSKFKEIVTAQGGDAGVLDNLDALPQAPRRIEVKSPTAGYLRDIDPMVLAMGVLDLGAGRKRAEDAIHHEVGLVLEKQEGDNLAVGQTLATLHTRNDAPDLVSRVESAFTIGDTPPEPRAMVHTLVTAKGHAAWGGGETWNAAVDRL